MRTARMAKWIVILAVLVLIVVPNANAQSFIKVATGAAAVATTLDYTDLDGAREVELIGFTLNLSLAPVASEAFTLTLDSVDGAAYDTLIYSRDLSVGSVTDVLYQFEPPVHIKYGDQIDFAWTNTNTRTYGLRIIYRKVR